jgi:hypothetical protein
MRKTEPVAPWRQSTEPPKPPERLDGKLLDTLICGYLDSAVSPQAIREGILSMMPEVTAADVAEAVRALVIYRHRYTAEEPSFDERLEPLLQPLRDRVTAAEEVFQRATAEAHEALMRRDDLERAAASLRNVTTDPVPRMQRPDPRAMFRMSDERWAEYKAAVARGEVA